MAGFNDYLGAIDSYLGDDDMLGAPAKHRRHHHAMARRPQHATAAHVLKAANTGVPDAGPRIEPLGFTTIAFVAGNLTLTATASPQKPFKGSRLVIAENRTATAVGLVSLSSLRIGVREVMVSAQPVPIAAFSPTAFGVELMLDECGPGIIITATFVISVTPAGAEVVSVGATIMGLSWS